MWDDDKITAFQKILLDWYDEQAIELPWRKDKDPYKIWISEIMLQQTRVDTVIPYFQRFIEAFPDVEALAKAKEAEVLKLWEGLGYYSRARNLKKAAEQIMIQYDGIFPSNPKEVIKLKGIGPYTTGAICSMAFNLPTPAIDGNLMRVLSRLFEIALDISQAKNRKVFETVALYLIDHDRPGDFNQALMDLGRTICTPKNYFPERSPVKEFNASYLNDTWQYYPVKKAKSKPKPQTYVAVVIQNENGEYLLEKRPDTGLLANMWMFPLVEVDEIVTDGTGKLFEKKILESLDEKQHTYIKNYVLNNYQLEVELEEQTTGVVEHIFSHLIWHISVFAAEIRNKPEDLSNNNCEWVSEDRAEELAFPKVQEKMWQTLQELTLF